MRNEESEQHIDESEFTEIAGSPAGARAVRKALETIAEGGAGATLKEMAQEVLTGRLGVREAMSVSAYADPMIEKIQATRERWDGLSEGEREAMASEGERYLAAQQQEIDDERTDRILSSSQSNPRPRHGGPWRV
ncbi:hypothetical protein [Streptomyces sioyaensis]|uniref:hypothetical protein n=1 Tax=Streptomyces sioyaensis TaxID=67364 RepID=UPI0036F0F7AF